MRTLVRRASDGLYHALVGSVVLGLHVFLGGFVPASAQMTSGAGLSSGTGQGTGAGGFSGVLRNRSGSLSGVGPGPSDISEGLRGRPVVPLPGSERRIPIAGFGPGVDVRFPNDPYIIPFLTMETVGEPVDPNAPTRVTDDLLKSARLITTPEERSLALQRIANGAIASSQLSLAHQTLEEAITATSHVTIPLVRDQRLIALVTSLTALTDASLRVGREALNTTVVTNDADLRGPEAIPKRQDPAVLIRMARLEWKRAVYLASIIDNPTYRNELLYRVAENEASGSTYIANEYLKPPETESLGNPAVPPNAAEKGQRKEPLKLEDRVQQRLAKNQEFSKLSDTILVDSFDVATKIDRLIWKYRAMVRIALLAADSQQYTRGVELSRGIDNAESRAEAMLLLAESQCRHGRNDAATPAYDAAARAVASVQQDGLRGVLVGFVVDSLIATGRFDDARACVVIYPEESQKLVALGAIAEAQGRRGAAESARRWIATDVPAEWRPMLYRRVTTGILAAIEANRSKESLRPEPVPPAR
jgi:hypothetical protein